MLATAGIIAFSILVVLGIVYFVFRSRVKSTADNEIYNNVYIDTVNVSGMKKSDAKKISHQRLAALQMELHHNNITLSE